MNVEYVDFVPVFIICARSYTSKTRKRCTGQVLPSAKYRPMCLVVDAALRRTGKSRHGDHKIANISVNCQWI